MAAAAAAADREAEEKTSRSYEERQSLEVALANMETRLRNTITELLQPTIHRTTMVVADLESVKNLVAQHTRSLQEVQIGQFKAQEQMSTITSFKEEMGRWDAQRRAHEVSIDEKAEAMQQKLEAYRWSLEQKESALHLLHRSVDRMASELNHSLEDQDIQKQAVETRLDELSKKINQSKTEIEVRITGMELKHNALTDELWGEETGLARVAGELMKTNSRFGKLESMVAELQEGKAEAAQLDKLRSEVGKMVYEANTSVTSMQQKVGNVVNDVREHFRTASQTISAHNATFIREVREQYQSELQNAAKVRDEVQEFMGQTTKNIAALDARVAGAAAKADALAAEAREEVEELNKRRKRDKTSSDNELKALKKRLGGVFDNSDVVLRGLEHIYAVLTMMLESDMIQCIVEQQDTIDRKKIALIGTKDEETVLSRSTHTEPQRPRPEVRSGNKTTGYPGPQKAGGVRPGKAQEPVVRVDNRCLSCSGQAPLVLSAFKMACLQYSPSPVEYEGLAHDRSDLLATRHTKLQTAYTALVEGRPGEHQTVALVGAAPPVPSGDENDHGEQGDPFSEYAAIEARFQQGNKSARMGQKGLRLPNVGSPSGALTVR